MTFKFLLLPIGVEGLYELEVDVCFMLVVANQERLNSVQLVVHGL